MRVFIGMETSGELRRRFEAQGHCVLSCDILPAEDGCGYDPVEMTGHYVGDVFDTLEKLRWARLWPDLAIFHPTCTYLTISAAWAFNDPDYGRYPGVGYHQRVKPDTLTGGGAKGCARTRARQHSPHHGATHQAQSLGKSHRRYQQGHSQAFADSPALPVRRRCQQGNVSVVYRQGWRGVARYGAAY